MAAGNLQYHTRSCGCLSKEQRESKTAARNALLLHHLNEHHGRVTITAIHRTRCTCLCDCGVTFETKVRSVLSGNTRSCGCLSTFKHQAGAVGLRVLFNRYKYKGTALKRGTDYFAIPLSEFKTLTSSPCYYCGAPPTLVAKRRSAHSRYLYNTLDRIDSAKGYTLDNVVPCCRKCNSLKLDNSMEDLRNQLFRIMQHCTWDKLPASSQENKTA